MATRSRRRLKAKTKRNSKQYMPNDPFSSDKENENVSFSGLLKTIDSISSTKHKQKKLKTYGNQRKRSKSNINNKTINNDIDEEANFSNNDICNTDDNEINKIDSSNDGTDENDTDIDEEEEEESLSVQSKSTQKYSQKSNGGRKRKRNESESDSSQSESDTNNYNLRVSQKKKRRKNMSFDEKLKGLMSDWDSLRNEKKKWKQKYFEQTEQYENEKKIMIKNNNDKIEKISGEKEDLMKEIEKLKKEKFENNEIIEKLKKEKLEKNEKIKKLAISLEQKTNKLKEKHDSLERLQHNVTNRQWLYNRLGSFLLSQEK